MKVLLFYGFPSVQKSVPTLIRARDSSFVVHVYFAAYLMFFHPFLWTVFSWNLYDCNIDDFSEFSLYFFFAFSHSCDSLKFIVIVTIVLVNRYFEVRLISDALSCWSFLTQSLKTQLVSDDLSDTHEFS